MRRVLHFWDPLSEPYVLYIPCLNHVCVSQLMSGTYLLISPKMEASCPVHDSNIGSWDLLVAAVTTVCVCVFLWLPFLHYEKRVFTFLDISLLPNKFLNFFSLCNLCFFTIHHSGTTDLFFTSCLACFLFSLSLCPIVNLFPPISKNCSVYALLNQFRNLKVEIISPFYIPMWASMWFLSHLFSKAPYFRYQPSYLLFELLF